MDYSTFIIQFPEFINAPESLVNALLAAAALEIDVNIWQAKAPQGVAYLAAHKLALSTYGQNVRLASKDGKTTYFTAYSDLRKQVTSGGFRVTGGAFSTEFWGFGPFGPGGGLW